MREQACLRQARHEQVYQVMGTYVVVVASHEYSSGCAEVWES